MLVLYRAYIQNIHFMLSPYRKSIGNDTNGSYMLTELLDNKLYYVTMCAMNINGCGEQSSPVSFVTPLGLPGECALNNKL